MASPFPGMDPYLEHPAFWSDFHHRFIEWWCEAIAERLPEQYEARLGEWQPRAVAAHHRRDLRSALDARGRLDPDRQARRKILLRRVQTVAAIGVLQLV